MGGVGMGVGARAKARARARAGVGVRVRVEVAVERPSEISSGARTKRTAPIQPQLSSTSA